MKTSIHQTEVDRERLLRLQKLYGARFMSETIRRAIDEALERRDPTLLPGLSGSDDPE